MTDLAANPPDTRAIIQRRLIGLLVLLFVAFLLSLLLRKRPDATDALPSVVIPLGGSAVTEASAPAMAPTLDAPQAEASPAAPLPSARSSERIAEPERRATESAPSNKPAASAKPAVAAAKPKPEKPAIAASKPAATPPAPKPPAPKPSGPLRWFVAVGAYKDPMAAQAIANRVKLAGFSASASPVSSGAERLHRVRAGPFASEIEAESARVTLIVEGLTKAVLISEK